MREPEWMGVFYEVPGGLVRCKGKRRNGQTGRIRDSNECLDGDLIYLIQWDKDKRDSWKPRHHLESADPRFPMPMNPTSDGATGGE